MKSTFLLLCLLLSGSILAEEKRIYQIDPYGSTQYKKPHKEIK